MECVECGRKLRSERSILNQIGPVCERKKHAKAQRSLFDDDEAPVSVPRFADGTQPGVLDNIAAMVSLLRDADRRLADPSFTKRLDAIMRR